MVVSKNTFPGSLQDSAHHQLIRGTNIINVQPLSTIHATQRLVHSTLKTHHLTPARDEQVLFEKLAEFTTGSPPILELTSAELSRCLDQAECSTEEALERFAGDIRLRELPELKPQSVPKESLSSQPLEDCLAVSCRNVSRELYESIKQEEDVFITSAAYDSWQVVTVLIGNCKLSPEERLLLFCLSSFNCCPIPTSYVTELSTIITKASHQPYLASSLHTRLAQSKILKVYPKPLVYHPSPQTKERDVDFVYIPRFISAAVWKDMMLGIDKVMALTTCYKALQNSVDQLSSRSPEEIHLVGVASILVESFELNFRLVGRSCYQEMYSLFLRIHRRDLAIEKAPQ